MTKKEDQLFKKFLEFESRNLKDFATATGQSYNQIRKYSASGKWLEKAAEYDAKKAAEGVVDSVTTEDFGLAASHSRLLAFKAAPAISQADFNTILLHAEKISNGQFDFIPTLRAELKNKLGIDTADLLIDSIKENPANSDNATRLFLAQFNFIVEGEGVNYHLVKLDDSTCELDIIPPAEVAENDTGEIFNLSADIQSESTKNAVISDSTTLLPITDLPAPSRSLEQLAADFNFKIGQGDLRVKEGLIFYIDAGKDLNLAKTLVKHGDWADWLKAICKYPIRRAQKYMQLADRFGYLVDKPEIAENLSVTQMFELLSLPEGEEQNFIDKLTAEGKALADMTQKETRAEVKGYNEELAAARAVADKEKQRSDSLQEQLDLFGDKLATAENETNRFKREYNDQFDKTQKARQDLKDAQKVIDRQAAENTELQDKIKELENKTPVTVEIEKKVIPADYESNKKALADSQEQILKLQAQLETKPAENESLQRELAEMKLKQADTARRAEVFAKLAAAADILATLDDSAKTFIKDFAAEYPDKFNDICKVFND